MNDFVHTNEKKELEMEFSFKQFFLPFTTLKAIHWIIFIGIVVYFNALFNGFVWDDLTFMINNPVIHVFNIATLFSVNNHYNGVGFYRPIPAMYVSLLWNLFGEIAFFYHFFQIILHILCTCLLFFFLRRFFSITLSFVLSLLFLIHPMQVENVAYITSTQNNFYFLFGISALLIGLKEKLLVKHFLLMSLFLLLSLLTKETGFLFILMILLYQFIYNRRYVLVSVAYSLGTVGVYLLIRFGYAQDFLGKNTTIPIDLLTLQERLINIPAIFSYYIQTFFYPVRLYIDQQWLISSVSFNDFYLPLMIDILFVIMLLCLGIFIYKRNRKNFLIYFFFAIWYFLGIGLVLQIFPLDATVSDRWFYFPIVGLLGLFGVFIKTLSIKKETIKRLIFVVAVIYFTLLSIRTMVRNTNYVDQLTLFSHDAAISRNGFDLENQLGIMYYQANNIAESRKHFQKAVLEMPCLDSTSNLEIVDQQIGDVQAVAKDKMILAKCAGK